MDRNAQFPEEQARRRRVQRQEDAFREWVSVTVPVLWDKQTRRIVNNSEDDICRMFNDLFSPLGEGSVELFPPDIAEEQKKVSAFIYENVNNGVYKAGFAT